MEKRVTIGLSNDAKPEARLHDQITKAFDTVTWLQKATKSFSEKNFKEAKKYIGTCTKPKKKWIRLELTCL